MAANFMTANRYDRHRYIRQKWREPNVNNFDNKNKFAFSPS